MKKVRSFDEFINESEEINERTTSASNWGSFIQEVVAKGATNIKILKSTPPKIQSDRNGQTYISGGTIMYQLDDNIQESEEINEAASWGVDVDEPFSDRDEKAAMGKFKFTHDPIVVVGASGTISDDIMDVSVQFSNADQIDYYYHRAPNSRGDHDLSITHDQSNIPLPDHISDKYFGSTGTVIGDLCLIYRDFLQNKIK